VKAELAEIEVETAENGVVVKADTLGSLEAMANALREAEVPILRAEVGDIAPATSPWPRPRTKTSTRPSSVQRRSARERRDGA